jgi:hypothetical protein
VAKNPNKQKPKQHRELGATEINPATGEDRRGEAVTVAWMLTMLATTAANVLALVASLVMPTLVAKAESPGLALLLPRILLFIAAVTGAVCVVLTPLVYRFRRTPPPEAITAFGLIISILPVLILFWQSTR